MNIHNTDADDPELLPLSCALSSNLYRNGKLQIKILSKTSFYEAYIKPEIYFLIDKTLSCAWSLFVRAADAYHLLVSVKSITGHVFP